MLRANEGMRLPAALGLFAFVGAGCFGSQYRDDGRHGAAAAVAVQDSVGIGLVGWSAALFHKVSQLEPSPGKAFSFLGASLVGAGGVGLIYQAETRCSRGKHGHGAERGVEVLRLSDPPRLRKLLWMRLGGLSLAVGGIVMGTVYLQREDDTLSILGSSVGLAGAFMFMHADRSLAREGQASHASVVFGPDGIALVCRF